MGDGVEKIADRLPDGCLVAPASRLPIVAQASCLRDDPLQAAESSPASAAPASRLPKFLGRFHFAPYDFVRILLGALVLVAAGLKGHQLATEPVLGTGWLESRWFLIGVVEFELFFGLWLLAGPWPRLTWAAALGCFGLFACVSLWKALSGAASCGCFGRVEVNPWYTFGLDVSARRSLAASRWLSRLSRSFSANAPYVLGGASLVSIGILAIYTTIAVSAVFSAEYCDVCHLPGACHLGPGTATYLAGLQSGE